MDKEQRTAFLLAQTACMYAELEAMKALNFERQQKGESHAYNADHFFDLPSRYGITHNQAIDFLLEYR